MHNHGRELTELSWLELVHVFGALVGAKADIDYSRGYSCRIDYKYTNPAGTKCCTGLAKSADTAEEAAEIFLHRVFKYMSGCSFPGLKLPELEFESKEDLAIKLAAAGVDPEFSLTHRGG